jgi:serine/threonine protein kinase
MLAISCSACHLKLSVQGHLAGKKIKCPACGQVTTVPALTAAPTNSGERTRPPTPGLDPASQATRAAPVSIAAGSQPTSSPLSKSNATEGVGTASKGHEPSLTDFLSPPQADDELGRLGKYRILKILGHGGMGVVFQAEDPKLKRKVALKAMLPALAASASAGQRFLREAQAMAAVENDHVVRIHQVDEERGVPFLAMEFLKGEPLDDRLQREPKLPVAEVLRIGREIAEGLAAAHATGLIHRDIKPANVWLEAPRARVKILDFGLARASAQDSSLTQQGAILGTPAYMAPEQARGAAVDARCDLFSLGVVLYRLCCGEQPFQGKDAISTLMEVATREPAPPLQLNANLPAELSELVMRLLSKDPAKRPASADEVIQALQALEKKLARQQGPPETTVILETSPLRTAAPPRRWLPVLIGALVLLAGLIALGAWALIRMQTEHAEYVVETDDPDFSFQVGKGGVALQDHKTSRMYALKVLRHDRDEHELEVPDADADLSFKTKTITIRRGQQVALKAWFERKPSAPWTPGPGTVEDKQDVKSVPPPEGAVVLFGGKDLKGWTYEDGSLAKWHLLAGGVMESFRGNILTKQKFDGKFKLHVEFRVPYLPERKGQARGNSGVFLQGRYELQILDSYGLQSKSDDCGAIYGVTAPRVNACKAPMVWQSFDIEYTAPKCKDGKRVEWARMTVFHNGVKIHDNAEVAKDNTIGAMISDPCTPGPIMLQYHGNAVAFRNIWLLPLDQASGKSR